MLTSSSDIPCDFVTVNVGSQQERLPFANTIPPHTHIVARLQSLCKGYGLRLRTRQTQVSLTQVLFTLTLPLHLYLEGFVSQYCILVCDLLFCSV
jgi:hypothetical protein|mmetsp:Transcript_28756/g.48962  ORF Transcript_28756/g.48962 Transcript_28756/m.48962 type:complete len:95 (-) Transcript_28756:511-795(-)